MKYLTLLITLLFTTTTFAVDLPNANTITNTTAITLPIDYSLSTAMPGLILDDNNERNLLIISDTIFYPKSVSDTEILASLADIFPNASTGITSEGMIYVIDGLTFYYAYLDYFAKLQTFGPFPETVQFNAIQGDDSNGMSILEITYSDGMNQNIYLFRADLKTINK